MPVDEPVLAVVVVPGAPEVPGDPLVPVLPPLPEVELDPKPPLVPEDPEVPAPPLAIEVPPPVVDPLLSELPLDPNELSVPLDPIPLDMPEPPGDVDPPDPPMVEPPNPAFSAFVDVTLVGAPPPTGAPMPPLDCIPAADPRLAAMLSSSCPKKTWIFVFCSPW